MAQLRKPSLKAGHRKAIGFEADAAEAQVAPSKRKAKNENSQKTLRAGHKEALSGGAKAPGAAQAPIVSRTNPLIDRYELLRDIPRGMIRKAWFTLAHLLLEPGATIVDMGSNGGEMAYVMAVLAPQFRFIAVDIDKPLIEKAQQDYKLPNLQYLHGDVGSDTLLKPASVDAIINSFILHEIYSGAYYNDRSVVKTLENQFKLLKPDGIMMIRDFAMPSTTNYVLMEMPDVPSRGSDLHSLSEADLLVWFSEQARPHQDPGCSGFFLEELPARFPKTRLFRLPAKWAYEFIMRKDERHIWEDELPKEYTFFSEEEYSKTLLGLGGRVLYTGPHWDEQYVKACFDGHFHLFDESGKALGTPPTSFIAIAQKVGDKTALRLTERRQISTPHSTLNIQPMRNELDGRIIDVISRDVSSIEIIPWRLNENGDLTVFVHIGAPRGIVNSVPRHGRDLDGKRWSGHMTEAIAVNSEIVGRIRDRDLRGTAEFMQDMFGLKPVSNGLLEKGPFFYPAPDFIDEHVETRFIEVEKPKGPLAQNALMPDFEGFQTRGRVIELSAQTILNAISVGIIPNAQLELQILALYDKIGMKAETWVDSPLSLPEADVPKSDVRGLLQKMTEQDTRYHKARASSGQWKPLQSLFVEEGRMNGGLMGLSARNIDFVVSDENSENVAVVLPLVKSLSGEVMAGYIADYLPVPQRHKGSGLTLTAPSIPLPSTITTMQAARDYIAAQFNVKPENVSRLGESFFCHIGVTPQRIYPFVVTEPVSGDGGPFGRGAYAPMDQLWKLLYWDNSTSFAKTMSMAYKNLGENSDLSPTWDFSKRLSESHDRPVSTYATDMRGLIKTSSSTRLPSLPGADDGAESSGQDRRKHIIK